jgi:hypothetical protein
MPRAPKRFPRNALAVCVSATIGAATFFCAGRASAQLHWDASARAGVAKRFFTSGGTEAPQFGPAFSVDAHVALVPLVRLGLYAAHDIATVENDATRYTTAGGARVKVFVPTLGGPLRVWGFVGAGYARTLTPDGRATHIGSLTQPMPGQPLPVAVGVSPRSGGFLEVPVGLGASWALRKPWVLTAELGGRFGALFHGDVYRGDVGPMVPAGRDAAAVMLVVGVGIDR